MPIKVDTEPIALVAVLPVTATSVTLDVTIAVPNDADADKPVSVKGVSDAAPPCITVCTSVSYTHLTLPTNREV